MPPHPRAQPWRCRCLPGPGSASDLLCDFQESHSPLCSLDWLRCGPKQRAEHPTQVSHSITLDPEWPPPPAGPLVRPSQGLTCGHQLHDQLGVGDVGAADLGPAGPQALSRHHTAHVICRRRILSVLGLPPTLGWARSLAGLALLPPAISCCSALGLSLLARVTDKEGAGLETLFCPWTPSLPAFLSITTSLSISTMLAPCPHVGPGLPSAISLPLPPAPSPSPQKSR